MAIEINEMKLPMSVDDAVSYLQHQTDSFGLFLDLDRLGEYDLELQLKAKTFGNAVRANLKMNLSDKLTNEVVKQYLINKLNVPSYKFRNKDGDNSFDKNVRAIMITDTSLSEDARHIIELYDGYSKAKYVKGYIGQYLECPMCNAMSYNNHRMVVAHPKWNPLRTGRISASEPSMQNIPRYMKDLITAPKGWILRRADSDQIEPRITYSWFYPDKLIRNIITAYGDAYAGIMHYTLLTPEQDALYRKDFSQFKKIEISDDFKDKRQMFKKLTLQANYGSNLEGIPSDIATAYKNKIINHPLKVQKEAELREAVNRGVEKFYTAFGSEIVPESTAKYKRGTSGWREHVFRCGLNNPIQGTASDLMLFSIDKVKKLQAKYSGINVAFYKHDEGAIYIEEDTYDKVKDELEDLTAYNVKDWIPITCEVEDGQLLSTEEVPTVLC